jgi:hypothetical protein
MLEWVSPRMLLEHPANPWYGDYTEAERQLYFAVIGGKIRAQLKGRMLGPEWLKQISKMKFSDKSAFTLPPDLELSVEDAIRIWTASIAPH